MNPNMSGESEKRIVVKGNASKYVKLNVGGNLFYTTIGTLTKYDSMLKAMFSGRMEVLTDPEGTSTLQLLFHYLNDYVIDVHIKLFRLDSDRSMRITFSNCT